MPTFDSKVGALGRLAYAGKGVEVEVRPEGLGQSQGGGGPPFTQWPGTNPSKEMPKRINPLWLITYC